MTCASASTTRKPSFMLRSPSICRRAVTSFQRSTPRRTPSGRRRRRPSPRTARIACTAAPVTGTGTPRSAARRIATSKSLPTSASTNWNGMRPSGPSRKCCHTPSSSTSATWCASSPAFTPSASDSISAISLVCAARLSTVFIACPVPGHAAVPHARAEEVEDRPRPLERRGVAAHHDLERARLGAGHAAAHARVEVRRAGAGEGLGEPGADARLTAGGVDHDRARPHAGGDTVVGRRPRPRRRPSAGATGSRRRRAAASAAGSSATGAPSAASAAVGRGAHVEHGGGVALVVQALPHARAHLPGADDPDRRRSRCLVHAE